MPAYNTTKVTTLDAATTDLSDIIAALIAHFTAAPNQWQIKTGVASVAGEAFVIQEKTGARSDLAFRRVGTTQLAVVVAPDKDVTAAGGSASEPTVTGGNASPSCQTGTMSGLSTRFFVVEHDDAVTLLFQNSGKTFTPYGIHAGIILDPLNANDPDLGLTGHGAMVGAPAGSGTNCWAPTTTQANGSRVRVFDDSGAADWVQITAVPSLPVSSSSSYASVSADEAVKSPRGLMLVGLDVNGPNDLQAGISRWFKAAPVSTVFPNLNVRAVVQSATDEAWAYIKSTTGASGVVVSWERGVNFT